MSCHGVVREARLVRAVRVHHVDLVVAVRRRSRTRSSCRRATSPDRCRSRCSGPASWCLGPPGPATDLGRHARIRPDDAARLKSNQPVHGPVRVKPGCHPDPVRSVRRIDAPHVRTAHVRRTSLVLVDREPQPIRGPRRAPVPMTEVVQHGHGRSVGSAVQMFLLKLCEIRRQPKAIRRPLADQAGSMASVSPSGAWFDPSGSSPRSRPGGRRQSDRFDRGMSRATRALRRAPPTTPRESEPDA